MPLSEGQKREVELLGGRRWGFNSAGRKFFCSLNRNNAAYLIWEENARKKTDFIVVPLPPRWKVCEMKNGWVRLFLIKQKENKHAVHSSSY
jgi:hypothetical protein